MTIFLALFLSWGVVATDSMVEVDGRVVSLYKDELRPLHLAQGVLWSWDRTGKRTDLDLGYSVEGVPPELREDCIEAIRRWGNSEYGIRIYLSQRPAGTERTIVFVAEPGDPSALATAEFPWMGGPSSTIRINTKADWSRYNLLSVLVHEVGHALGFSHVNDEDSIMRPFYTGQLRPGWSDMLRATQLYLTRPWPNRTISQN